ncbi:hypothetical protein Rsub_10125 [Raphidocelis subcapitata]|uniref:HIRAN domain-containing protein n=1 Tax=Raphidocelis subcapitata TaxID=307507 RepID=A0A2V0PB74_9CHLO|nr:hypothetical protein Rsub_10125 [Raphidocelis subcapitata]|eukprot:GBF97114.1 hypothetical protein Rsub_10125 [Raphidocelis subcapitata]
MRRAAPALARRLASTAAAAAAHRRSTSSSSGGAAYDIAAHTPLLLEARQLLEDLAPVEILPVAGVTFEGRQDLLKALTLRQAVLAVREPDNAYDPNAVRLETAAGEKLGYVPRTLTGLFKLEVSTGHVESVGPTADNERLGARVRLWPTLPAVTLDPLPAAMAAQIDFEKVLGAERWASRRAAALARGCCAFTGVPASRLPLEPVPLLRYATNSASVSVVGVAAAAAPVARAMQLSKIRDAGERAAALALVVGLNGWGPEDLESYLRRVHSRRRQLESEGWAVDLSSLLAAEATAAAAAAQAADADWSG